MTTTFTRLLKLADVPRSRVALSVLLGGLTVLFGVGLMATAGYLISRAAERPAVLSLTAAIVGVRFFGLGRPVLRYLERLSSHDVAFRALGRARLRVYERLEMPSRQLPWVERRHAPVLTVWKEVVRRCADPHARSELILPPPRVKAVRREADWHVCDEGYLARGARELLMRVELRPLMKGDAVRELGASLLDAPGARRLKR